MLIGDAARLADCGKEARCSTVVAVDCIGRSKKASEFHQIDRPLVRQPAWPTGRRLWQPARIEKFVQRPMMAKRHLADIVGERRAQFGVVEEVVLCTPVSPLFCQQNSGLAGVEFSEKALDRG